MRNIWIFEILNDMREFALQNNLPGLARDLDNARFTAASEIAKTHFAELKVVAQTQGWHILIDDLERARETFESERFRQALMEPEASPPEGSLDGWSMPEAFARLKASGVRWPPFQT